MECSSPPLIFSLYNRNTTKWSGHEAFIQHRSVDILFSRSIYVKDNLQKFLIRNSLLCVVYNIGQILKVVHKKNFKNIDLYQWPVTDIRDRIYNSIPGGITAQSMLTWRRYFSCSGWIKTWKEYCFLTSHENKFTYITKTSFAPLGSASAVELN
jgi:hypothetical protein